MGGSALGDDLLWPAVVITQFVINLDPQYRPAGCWAETPPAQPETPARLREDRKNLHDAVDGHQHVRGTSLGPDK